MDPSVKSPIENKPLEKPPRAEKRFSVAPMMDWTDRHYRFLARQLSKRAVLYTEMIHARAIVHGDRSRFLDFHPEESPVVLQLGGNEPEYLAEAARWAERWGYSEINLNCGCPSEKVASGSFGACLMADPGHVARLVETMKKAVSIPVTVKSRIGIEARGMNPLSDYEHLRRFTATMVEAGCDRLIVHARIAVLGGLNPAENRTVPPLRYEDVYRLKDEFPELPVELNGGLREIAAIQKHLNGPLDGVMVGRAAYETPRILLYVDDIMNEVDAGMHSLGQSSPEKHSGVDWTPGPSFGGQNTEDWRQATGDMRAVRELERLSGPLQRMGDYIVSMREEGVPAARITRHLLGLFHGLPGAKRFRQTLSGNQVKQLNDMDDLDGFLRQFFAETLQIAAGESAEAMRRPSAV
ncbi:MAG: tRNA dihydrouridine(20/20a) synthase DusA [Spirochaetaceae bacterium]|nr:tRNA dihydrouridine(20/20a) synthase DusA [Spirochaetaceae bacterium]|tara:strand:- start:85027 stop:86253 length:1227 start_codon:yes stop_codon:yes gene_type:complete